jgi:hypothetical protein
MAKIDFFLSFNRADRAAADLVYETVTGAGYSCFYQHQDIPEGANFVQGMTLGLEEAATMLALYSPAYFQSKFALAELHAAFADDPLNERKSILPLLIKEYDVPKLFKFLAFVDCRNLVEADFRAKLLTALTPYRNARARQADSRIPETNTAGAAQKLLDDLEVAYAIFQSQSKVRNALVDAMCERDPNLELVEYEPFIARYYTKMTPDERALHQRIRDYTDTIEKLNRHALYCIEASKDFRRRIPGLEKLREHLEAWLDKYDRTFETDASVGVLYVGVQERKPFPSGIEAEIRQYIVEKSSGSTASGS